MSEYCSFESNVLCVFNVQVVFLYDKRRNTLESVMRRLWCRNTLLQIPVIAKSKLLPHEINGLVNKMTLSSFPKGKITVTSEMKAAM